jgi:exonuclease SbcC
LKTAEQDCQNIEAQIGNKNNQQQSLCSKRERFEKEASKIEEYLFANTNDALLISELTGINEQIKGLKIISDHLVELNKQVLGFKTLSEENGIKHANQQTLCQSLQEKHDESINKVKQTKHAIKELLGDRLLREYRAEHDNLLREMDYLKKIASLEEEREKLVDDAPCPLC